jgi:hypothetical protein
MTGPNSGLPPGTSDIERLTNTSDLYGLLGEEGLLSKLGVNVGYMPTDWAGDAFDFIDNVLGTTLGDRPQVNVVKSAEKAVKEIEAIQADGSLPVEVVAERIKNVKDQFLRDTARYDERFFDLFTPRGDSPMSGIWETNPYASTGGTFTGFPTGGNGGLPSTAPGTTYTSTTEPTPEGPAASEEEVEEAEFLEEEEEEEQFEEELEANEDALAVVEDLTDVSKDELQDVVEAVEEGELSLGAPPGWGDTRLPSGGDSSLPVSGDDSNLPGVDPNDKLQYNSDGSVFNWTTGKYEVFPGADDSIVTSGGGGFNPGAAALAAGIGGDDFKKFMAGIDYVVPVLQALNIPFEDYMAMWIQGNKA